MVRIDTPRILHRSPISIAITNVCTGFSLKNICQSIILLVILETHNRHSASKIYKQAYALRFIWKILNGIEPMTLLRIVTAPWKMIRNSVLPMWRMSGLGLGL